MPDDDITLIWRDKPDPKGPCRYARNLTDYGDELIAELRQKPQAEFHRAMADAKAHLLDRYALNKAEARQPHTNDAGKGRNQHRCVNDALDHVIIRFNDLARAVPARIRYGDDRDEPLDRQPFAFGIEFEQPPEAEPTIGFDTPRRSQTARSSDA